MKSLVIIPSRSRSETIASHSLRLFPTATVCVPQDQAPAYSKATANFKQVEIVAHPKLRTLAAVRNWIFENIKAQVLIMADDDLTCLRSMSGWRTRDYHDPQVVNELLDTTAICAKDAHCAMFGFSRSPNQQHFKPFHPMRLDTWVARVIGFVGQHGLRFDERLGLYDALDISLQSLLQHRIILADCRWCFVPSATTLMGGLTLYRTEDRQVKERQYLQAKWGDAVVCSSSRDPNRLTTNVQRQQPSSEQMPLNG